jgi:hypothetical protein
MKLLQLFLVFSGEMRQVHCHIYFCRQSDFENKLEKWKCTGCAENTPECKVRFYNSKSLQIPLCRITSCEEDVEI